MSANAEPASAVSAKTPIAGAAAARWAGARARHYIDRRPTAAVSLGDSYISGEAARWKGNSAASTPGRLGTDRAWQPSPTDPAGIIDLSTIYGDTVTNGCHRSDVAPILSADLPVQKSINLACSGATTANVRRAVAGGVAFKGEAPQDDQLAAIAQADDVKLVVLSIGGNDLGFSDILTSCVSAYLFSTPPCSAEQPLIEAALPQVALAVAATVADIRATMAEAGYSDRAYRLILESYPSPLPAPGNARYSGTALDERATVGGCPFLDVDSAWAYTSLIPAMTSTLAAVATSTGVDFLDLTDAFRGHELCAAADQQSTGDPRSASSEWIRFVDLTGQGDSAESLHPDYFGQLALGRCLALAARARDDVACHAIPTLPARAVYLTRAT